MNLEMILSRSQRALLSALALTLSLASSAAASPATICVYDPAGANGDIFQSMQDYRNAAVAWNVEIALRAYTDERIAAEDFQAQRCDGAVMTGTRGRALNPFSSTLEAMGALPSYNMLKALLRRLLSPRGGRLLNGDASAGHKPVAGIFPGGAVYLLVRDRAINTVEALAGKRIATLSFDDAAKRMVRQVGASMTAADVSTFAGMFNNGSVDAAYAPAAAYRALELHKGIRGGAGGVIRYPLAQMTLQLFVHPERFPDDFLAKSRAYSRSNLDRALRAVRRAEQSIEEGHWVDIPAEDRARYDQMFQEVRVRLRDAGIYQSTALKLMRRVRCRIDGSRAECASSPE